MNYEATNTKLAKSTILNNPGTTLNNPGTTLEAHACKPLVTKLASILHTLVYPPQLCLL